MYEVLPILAGVCLASVLPRRGLVRWFVLVPVALAAGPVISEFAGEWEESWGYGLLDAAQLALAALATQWLVDRSHLTLGRTASRDP